MNWLKKFWIIFVSFLPFSAGAFWPLVIGVTGASGILGYSIFRSISPVNLSDALTFFSTCWSCQLFSEVIGRMSQILPRTYDALGKVIIPFAITLTAIWFSWQVLKVYIGPKKDVLDGWSISGKFGTHITKLLCLIALLSVPLPRMISSVIIEPTFNIGLSMNYTLSADDARENYTNCIIATAISDRQSIENDLQKSSINAFSPRFRHNLTCQIANIHQMTGVGMMVGWSILNMAFDNDYMHSITPWHIPIFPNIPMVLLGVLILGIYFAALLPIPLYFLEIFVKLSIDFILLPLTMLGWLFKGWDEIFPKSKSNIQQTINDVISGVLGLALTGIFITFSVMVLNTAFGSWEGVSILDTAMARNDSKMLIDGLMSNIGQKALVSIILLGIFMFMFMTMIPALIKSLFNVTVSDKYYQNTKKELTTLWSSAKKWWDSAKK